MAKRTTPRAPRAPRQQAAQDQNVPQEQGSQGSVATLAREPGQPASGGPQPDDIARRAYEIYCARGGQHGRAMDDWLQAESELKGR